MASEAITTPPQGDQVPNDRQALLHHMATKHFWSAFFECYQKTVHPAEYAVVGQKEQALSAAFHRTLLLHREALGLGLWVPVLEAPIKAERGGTAYCDITLIPWDANHLDESWKDAKDPGKHVRIEVKWRDMAYPGPANAIEIYEVASTNESHQHFSLNLIFHGPNKPPDLSQDFTVWPQHDSWEPLALEVAARNGAPYSPGYSTLTLVVLKHRKQFAQDAQWFLSHSHAL